MAVKKTVDKEEDVKIDVKYIVLETFKDKDGTIYKKDNLYTNKKVTKERLKELSTDSNKYKRAFIKEA